MPKPSSESELREKNESAIEFVRRLVNNLDYEHESILDDLPTIESLIDYLRLWKIYDTEFMSGIRESILEGDDPAPLLAFIRKHKIDWNTSWIPRAKQAKQGGH